MALPAGTLAETMNSVRVSAFRAKINQNLTSGVWYPTLSDVWRVLVRRKGTSGASWSDVKGRLSRWGSTSFFE